QRSLKVDAVAPRDVQGRVLYTCKRLRAAKSFHLDFLCAKRQQVKHSCSRTPLRRDSGGRRVSRCKGAYLTLHPAKLSGELNLLLGQFTTCDPGRCRAR
ncbi:hypothetical protein NDU88_004946, partial [Pleurodeles waltl]